MRDHVVESPFEKPELLIGSALLAGVLIAGALVVYFVDLWRKRASSVPQQSVDELTRYREMLEAGAITEAEYARLRGLLAGKLKESAARKPLTRTASGRIATPPGPRESPIRCRDKTRTLSPSARPVAASRPEPAQRNWMRPV